MTKTTSSRATTRKVAAGMTPCGDYVLVTLLPAGEHKTEAGLFVPATGDARIARGMVKAISPHVLKSKFGLKVGDAVLVSKFARTESVSGSDVLVHAESIMAVA